MGTPLNVAILMSRVRVEEKLLLTELEKRGVEIQRIDDREIMLDLERPNLHTDVVLERAVNHLRALYALACLQRLGQSQPSIRMTSRTPAATSC